MSEELRPARSQAELIRVRQGWTLIVLASLNVLIGLALLAAHFGII